MKVALIQTVRSTVKEENFKKAQEYIREAVSKKADVVCLSENFLYEGNVSEKEGLSSKYIISFRTLAKKLQVNVVLGSIVLFDDSAEKPTNSCLVINRQGEVIYRYDKKYMYDVERDDFTFRESDNTKPGTSIGLFELDGIKMGVGICVDLRYPEYFRELMKKEALVVFLPSNFRKVTGRLAWDILPRARAIENQLYFCACSQTGGEGNKERCGNSSIISFNGEIVSKIGEEEGIVVADLDFDELKKFRKEFPVLRQVDKQG